MRRGVAFFIAGLVVAGEATGLWLGSTLLTAELPAPWVTSFVLLWFPYMPPLGVREDGVDRFFGETPNSQSPSTYVARKCVRYHYSKEEVVTVYFENGIATDMWLTSATWVPESCAGLVERTVRVSKPVSTESGYFVCERRPTRR